MQRIAQAAFRQAHPLLSTPQHCKLPPVNTMALAAESHPQRQKIIDMLLAGHSLKLVSLSINPKLSRMSILRFKRTIVVPALKRAASVTAPVVSVTPVTSNADQNDLVTREASADLRLSPAVALAQKRFSMFDRTIPIAEQDKDFRGLASLANAERGSIELFARLTGELRDEGRDLNIQVNLVIPQGHEIPQKSLDSGVITAASQFVTPVTVTASLLPAAGELEPAPEVTVDPKRY